MAISGSNIFAGTNGNGVWVNSVVTGIKDLNIKNRIAVYPNPAKDIVTINIDNLNNENIELNIYSAMGALVRSEMLKQKQINIADLRSGIYIFEIKSENCSEKQKLIIQR